MTEYPIARAYADARITRIYGGTNEIMKEIIGRSMGLEERAQPLRADDGVVEDLVPGQADRAVAGALKGGVACAVDAPLGPGSVPAAGVALGHEGVIGPVGVDEEAFEPDVGFRPRELVLLDQLQEGALKVAAGSWTLITERCELCSCLPRAGPIQRRFERRLVDCSQPVGDPPQLPLPQHVHQVHQRPLDLRDVGGPRSERRHRGRCSAAVDGDAGPAPCLAAARELHAAPLRDLHPPDLRGGAVAEHRAVAHRECRRQPPALGDQYRVTHGVEAPVQRPQKAAGHAAVDPSRRGTEGQERRARDHPEMRLRPLCNPLLERSGVLTPHTEV